MTLAEARTALAAAESALAAAVATRDGIADRIAAGGTGKPSDFTDAETAIRDAETAVMFHRAVLRSAAREQADAAKAAARLAYKAACAELDRLHGDRMRMVTDADAKVKAAQAAVQALADGAEAVNCAVQAVRDAAAALRAAGDSGASRAVPVCRWHRAWSLPLRHADPSQHRGIAALEAEMWAGWPVPGLA